MPIKILIVDDEPFNLDLLEQELADLGYPSERAVVVGEGPEPTVHHLPARVIGAQPAGVPLDASFHDAINRYRRELIVRTLAAAQGNRAEAAKALSMHRTHLMKLLRLLQIT